MFVPESLRKQNELVRTLHKQLQATEKELADQKWILEQYLNSPSWKLTAPLRWLVRKVRAIKEWIVGGVGNNLNQVPPKHGGNGETIEELVNGHDAAEELKELYASVYRVALQSFLTSGTELHLPWSSDPVISIILVLFNRAELTLACLRSIREEFAEKIEVIIVDNASSDLTSRLLDQIRGAHIIRNSENRNFLLAVNQAGRVARGQYLLLLNNDAQLMPGSLRASLDTIESDEKIGAVGGRIVLYDGSLQEAGSIVWQDGSCLGYGRGDNPFASSYMFRRDVDYCSGAFLLTRRAGWEQLNGFDERFVPAYYEETDYCARLWENGFRVVYEPSAVVLHYEFASSKPSAATDLQAQHQRLFAKKHAGLLQTHLTADVESVLAARMCPAAGPLRRTRILFIDDRVPHPWLGSGFPRARTLLLTLRKEGFFITLFPMAVVNEDWEDIYSDLPRDIEVMNEMGPRLLEAFLRNRRSYYDAIVISRPHNMSYLKPIVIAHPDWFENVTIIYDAEALFAPRDVGLSRLRGDDLSQTEVEQIYRDEISLTSVADCVIAVSEPDRIAFESRGVANVHVAGHSLNLSPSDKSFDQRSGFLFVGAVHEEASPNGDSVIWFLSEIWPRIQAQLGLEVPLTIAGVNNSERIRSLAGPSVTITGHVPDISPLYGRARVFIAPTRYAAGMPHKVHEASARGLPVVATSILASQLSWLDNSEILVAQDSVDFAEKCVRLHQDKELWTRLRDDALAAVARDCAQENFEQKLRRIFITDRVRLKKKRYADAGMDR